MSRSPDYPSDLAHGLMFHRLHKVGERSQGQGSLSSDQLEGAVRRVGLERILCPSEWIKRVDDGTLNEDDLCLTFDDGLKCHIEVALPVLERLGLKGFFFIFSSVFEGGVDRNEVYNRFAVNCFASFDSFVGAFFGFYPVADSLLDENGFEKFQQFYSQTFPFYSENDIKFRFVRNKLLKRPDFEDIMDRMIQRAGYDVFSLAKGVWMDDEDLRTLVARGHRLGLHSYDHPFTLADLTVEQQQVQYSRNRNHIVRVTGGSVDSMSHPLNSYGDATFKVLADLGIVCGFRSNLASIEKKSVAARRLELPRVDGAMIC